MPAPLRAWARRNVIVAACIALTACSTAWAATAPLSGDALEKSAKAARMLRIGQPGLFQGARGALVVDVVAGSQAEAAGIQPGDVLIRYAGMPIDDNKSFIDAVASRRQAPGDVDLVYLHEGATRTAHLKPGTVGIRPVLVRYDLTAEERLQLADLHSQMRHAEAADFLERRGGLEGLVPGHWFDLCLAYTYAGRFGKMATCFQAQQRHFHEGKVYTYVDPEHLADISSTGNMLMARGYLKIGNTDKALVAARHAVQAAANDKPNLMHAMAALAETHAAMGKLAQAREVAQQMEAIEPDPAADAVTVYYRRNAKHMGLMMAWIAAGDPARALQALDKLLPTPATVRQWYVDNGKQADLQRIDEEEKFSQGTIRANLLLDLGRTDGLEAIYDEALAHPNFRLQERYWATLFNRGRLAEGKGRQAEAIRFYAQAVDVIERQRASLNDEIGKIGFAGTRQQVYARLVKALVDANRAAEAFDYAERAKARALVDMLAARQTEAKAASPQAAASLAEISRSRDELAALAAQKTLGAQQVEERRRGLSARIDAATEALRTAAPEHASLVTATVIPESRLRALLDADETLVEYYLQGEDLYAFVGTANALRVVRLDASNLSEQVRQFRAAVQDPRSKGSAGLAQALHARLLAPLGLPAQGKLLVVPHGVLHYVPFNALRDARGDLVDRYSIRLLPSASVLAFLQQRKATGQGLLVLGNPDLGNPEYDLPGAQREAAEIARLRPDAKVLLRAAATKEALKAEGGKYALLHFASHGKFNPERPLQSGLYLAGRETAGVLTVDELYGLDLHADLVTLSACETALGRIDSGDDVIGLTRGFFYAGASSIVSSLWEVDDEATSLLMAKFYGELARTPKGEALRAAQRAVKSRFPHPFYWAAFQLTGNAR